MWLSANWKGYFGTWEVKQNGLFLTNFSASVLGVQGRVGLDYLFPGRSEVFASWYTGEITAAGGALLHQFPNDHWEFEKYVYLSFQEGRLVSEQLKITDLSELQDRIDKTWRPPSLGDSEQFKWP
jgi:hypothetical protein